MATCIYFTDCLYYTKLFSVCLMLLESNLVTVSWRVCLICMLQMALDINFVLVNCHEVDLQPHFHILDSWDMV